MHTKQVYNLHKNIHSKVVITHNVHTHIMSVYLMMKGGLEGPYYRRRITRNEGF